MSVSAYGQCRPGLFYKPGLHVLRGTQTDQVNIYDTPLQVLAGLLSVGFVLSAARATVAGKCPSRTRDCAPRAYVVSGFRLR
jgi:hypothetical protein